MVLSLITGNPIFIFKFQRARNILKNYKSRSTIMTTFEYHRWIQNWTKKKRSNIEIRNSATENNIPPTLLHDSSYRRTNRYCSRTSNCTPPRGKIRNRRAAVEPWLDSRRWSPISRTRGGKSSSSRQPWSAWIRPGMYGRRDVFPLTNPCLVQTSLSDSVAPYAKNDNFTGPAPRAWLTGFLCGIQYTSWELLWPRGWWIEG